MTAIKDLLNIQVGQESPWGSMEEPTKELSGITDVSINPVVDSERVDDIRSSLSPGSIVNVLKTGAEASVEGVVLFEEIPYWLDSLFGEATPAGGDPYTYSYAAPLDAVPSSPRAQTIAYGDGTNDYRMVGALVTSLGISGESNSVLEYSASLMGQSVVASGIIALSPADSVTVAMGHQVALFIDAGGGTIGDTPIATTAFSFDLDIASNREALHHLGSIAPDSIREAKWGGTLALTLEVTSTTKEYLDAILAASSVLQKLVRIKATSGANTFTIDFSGFIESAPEIFSDEDGVTTIELEFTGKLDTGTFDNWLEMEVVNSISALS